MQSRAGLRLMCVDDERSALINCKFAIQKIPAVGSATFFQTVAEAVEYVKTNPIDIAFLDVDLPEISGFELARQIQAICPMAKIGFITGNITYMDVSKRTVEAPYVFKPFFDDEIAQMVKQLQPKA